MPRGGGFGFKSAGRAFAPAGDAGAAVEVGRRRASSPPGAGGAAAGRPGGAPDDGGRIERLCAERGLKMTGQRRLIARVLSEAQDHPDVEEVYRRALALDNKVSIATVYRTVRLFEERGILERHDFGGGRARYEPAEHGHHHHLIDVDTGQVAEFQSEEHERLAREIAAGLGFELVGHRLELFGRRTAPKAGTGTGTGHVAPSAASLNPDASHAPGTVRKRPSRG
jgi:Fur family transcriptional regulator, ferric uptake regulator